MATTNVPAKPGSTEAQQPAFIKAVLAAEAAFLNAYGPNNPDAQNVWYRESMFAMQAVKGSENLQKCTLESIKNSVVNIALTGATLNPARKHADLVPRNVKVKGLKGEDRWENQACLDFRYGGLIDIAVNSGAAISLNAYVVYTWDEFSYDVAAEKPVKLKPCMKPVDEKGELIDPDKIGKDPKLFWKYLVAVVSKAVLPSRYVDWVVLPAWKIMKTMETAKTKNVWLSWPEEQARKTGIKYHSKTLQGNHQDDKFAYAVKIQNDLDGVDTDQPKGRDTGKELENRFKLMAPAAQESESGVPAENPTNASGEGLSGARLSLYERVAEQAAGNIAEMNKILYNLSAGKVECKTDLIGAEDSLIQQMINKITGSGGK